MKIPLVATLSHFRKSSFLTIFLGKGSSHFLLFTFVIVLNLLSAVMEGSSFGLILASFSALEGNQESIQKSLGLFGEHAQTLYHYLPQGKEFLSLALLAIVAQIFRSAFAFAGQVFNTLISTKIQQEAQQRVFAQIFRMSFPCVSTYKVGDLVEYAKSPATVISMFMESMNRLIVAGLDSLACVFVMFYMSPRLALLSLFVFGVFGVFIKLIVKKISEVSCSLTKRLVEFSKHAVQSLHGLRAIFIFDRQANTMAKIKTTLTQVAELTKQVNLWNNSFGPLNEIMNVSLVGAFLILGQTLLSRSLGSGSIPLLLTFITLVYRFGTRLQIVILNIGNIAVQWGGILRLEDILSDHDKEFADCNGKRFPGHFQQIIFDNVSMQYRNSGVHALKNFNLVVPCGATIALVGASGAGKSSVIDLLVRLFDPVSGQILVDDCLLKDYEVGSWRNRLGVVSQDSYMFDETIEENIRFGALDATYEQIQEAAKIAGAHDFIMKLPHQYHSVVGEKGHRLSGGERQRIALARALVRNPDILILDEATSNLDSRSERFIQDALMQLRGKKTILVVAHRLSTISSADTIYVLEHGEVVESGTHLELILLNGHYSHYWDMQAVHKTDRDGFLTTAKLS